MTSPRTLTGRVDTDDFLLTEQASSTLEATEKSPVDSPDVEEIIHEVKRGNFSEALQPGALDIIPHLKDNPKIEIKIVNGERAVFASENIQSGEIISVFSGPLYTSDRISMLPTYVRDHCVQVGPKSYIYGEKGMAELINHSCDPNCGIKHLTEVVAMRDIKAGEQITWDYEMTENSDWEMPDGCKCGNTTCRKSVKAHRFLPKSQKEKYKDYVSEWLTTPALDLTNVKPENYVGGEVPQPALQEAADLFLRIFSNEWPEYIFCPKCDPKEPGGMRMSAREVYKIQGDASVPLPILKHNPIIPDCPCCQEKMELFLHPDVVLNHLQERLSKDAWLTLLKDTNNNPLGFTYCYERPLREVFESEWGTLYPYARMNDDLNPPRSFDSFYAKLATAHKEAYPDSPELLPDSRVIGFNCIGIIPEAQSKGIAFKLAVANYFLVPRKLGQSLGIGEAFIGSVAHTLFRQAGALEIQGIYQEEKDELVEGDYVIVAAPLDAFAKRFTKSTK